MKVALKALNLYEAHAGLKTKTSLTSFDNKVFMFSGPSLWLKAPALISMYTLIIRACENQLKFKTLGELEDEFARIGTRTPKGDDRDLNYLYYTSHEMSVVVKHATKIFGLTTKVGGVYKKDSGVNISTWHNYAGIVSLCKLAYYDKAVTKRYKAAINEEALIGGSPKKKKVAGKKKKLMRIAAIKPIKISPYNHYDADDLDLALCSPPTGDKEPVRRQLTTWCSCREHLLDGIRAALSKGKLDSHRCPEETAKIAEVSTDKARLLARIADVDKQQKVRVAKHKKELFFAKKALHVIETQYGFTGKSLVATVKMVSGKQEETAWLFTGPAEWMQDPAMFHLYGGLIRSLKNAYAKLGSKDLKTVDDIEEYLLAWKKAEGTDSWDDFIPVNFKKIKLVMEHRNKIFKKRSVKTAWSITKSKDEYKYSKYAGIHSLVRGNSCTTVIQNNYKKVLEAHK